MITLFQVGMELVSMIGGTLTNTIATSGGSAMQIINSFGQSVDSSVALPLSSIGSITQSMTSATTIVTESVGSTLTLSTSPLASIPGAAAPVAAPVAAAGGLGGAGDMLNFLLFGL